MFNWFTKNQIHPDIIFVIKFVINESKETLPFPKIVKKKKNK